MRDNGLFAKGTVSPALEAAKPASLRLRLRYFQKIRKFTDFSATKWKDFKPLATLLDSQNVAIDPSPRGTHGTTQMNGLWLMTDLPRLQIIRRSF